LRPFWSDDAFAGEIARRGALLKERLDARGAAHGLSTRGRGMMRGINLLSGKRAEAVTTLCFKRGLIIETSGAHDEIVKVLAPLVIKDAELSMGLDILEESIREVLATSYGVAAE
jgi:diaminobutyrate-2-oxoglutarate transaminase